MRPVRYNRLVMTHEAPLLTRQDFEALSDSTFRLVAEVPSDFAFELDHIRALGGESDAREPFSLVFRGPLEPILAQSLLRLEHSELGTLELFLVPVGPDKDNAGIVYEAVFS